MERAAGLELEWVVGTGCRSWTSDPGERTEAGTRPAAILRPLEN